MFEGMTIGINDMNGKVIKEGDKIHFNSSMYGLLTLEGIVKYDSVNCRFFIMPTKETNVVFTFKEGLISCIRVID